MSITSSGITDCKSAALARQGQVWCRKVEHICEETDAIQHALDKHTRKERRCSDVADLPPTE